MCDADTGQCTSDGGAAAGSGSTGQARALPQTLAAARGWGATQTLMLLALLLTLALVARARDHKQISREQETEVTLRARMSTSRRRRVRRGLRYVSGVAIALTAVILFTSALAPTASATEPLAGTAGVDTSLPPTSSAVTVSGRGAFSGLEVSVNQTANLTNQAVSVTWSGAAPSSSVSQNFLQIFQCWGDDDGTNPDNPGPPPEKCEFGGQPFTGNLAAKLPADVAVSNEFTRAIGQASWPGFDPAQGVFDSQTGKVWKPFTAVDGTQVDEQLKVISSNSNGVSVAWQNPYFDFNSTNEIPFGRTYLNGTGSELFQLDTGLEAPGLGCGQAVEVHSDGSKTIPKCWLVVVPRRGPADENPLGVDPNRVITSPLAPNCVAEPDRDPAPVQPRRLVVRHRRERASVGGQRTGHHRGHELAAHAVRRARLSAVRLWIDQ